MAASTLLLAAPAQAGSYDVWSCRDASGQPLPAEGWRLTSRGASAGEVAAGDGCAGGGSLELRLADQALPGSPQGMLTFAAPPGTTIAGYQLDRYMNAAVPVPGDRHVFTVAVHELTATTDTRSACASYLALPDYPCSAMGSSTNPADPANAVLRTGVALDALQLRVTCDSAGCDRPFYPPGALVRLYRARITLSDTSAPTTPQLSGSLVAGAALDARGTLVVESSDDGGGIAATTLAIDGGAPAIVAPAGPRGACALPYTAPQPCPAAAARAFEVDTAALAAGAHSASGAVVDAAGNVTPYGPVSFTVAHPPSGGEGATTIVTPPPAVPDRVTALPDPRANGFPAVRVPLLTFDRATYVRSGGRAVRVGGTLSTPDGVPITDARLQLSTRDLGTVAARRTGGDAVVTDRYGRFSLALPAPAARDSGAQRVEVSFSPDEIESPTTSAATVVRSDASVTATRSKARLKRGQAVVIGGRIERAGLAAKGAVVELQAVVRGRWRTVGTVFAAADGRYRWRYRFVNTTRDTIFSFRALVRSSPGWPWPELRSRSLQVRVDADR
ncbi:hypothetical protein Q5424_22745 [Conexibacter sp. JD483]|uniref:hypothetical protein n=1 Tax=unclassified Conexibacter TaxID=2627773 RepID=UPI002728DAA8|nr:MULTISPECIES: hypothetical protein [unclassified Conexibacter]MDO8188464.1 hypothetical protein [Conexibacter sp. CPCC 205706]MDO8199175.1 hypothetical protein [Conexibacter sp. CPCC 205762]MDR9371934.1 hypothetical protein [Conexibacter sp. JD483]